MITVFTSACALSQPFEKKHCYESYNSSEAINFTRFDKKMSKPQKNSPAIMLVNFSIDTNLIDISPYSEAITFKPYGNKDLYAKSYKVLDEISYLLLENKKLSLVIQSHTSALGSFRINKKLSIARALTVKEYIVAHGISPNRIQTFGFGESRPIANNSLREGRFKNNRIDITLK